MTTVHPRLYHVVSLNSDWSRTVLSQLEHRNERDINRAPLCLNFAPDCPLDLLRGTFSMEAFHVPDSGVEEVVSLDTARQVIYGLRFAAI